MIFVDYLGPADRLDDVRAVSERAVSAALRVPPGDVVVRHVLTADPPPEVELWVELSSEEQLYRLGRSIAEAISDGLRPDGVGPNVWVMFRIVPLNRAFLNGAPRGRGTPSFD
ncbi:MAG: hypothetical protein JO023_05925 [Chloroflexi bacterium]|nr:hypothetical protein [Chloroflexota bacterium]